MLLREILKMQLLITARIIKINMYCIYNIRKIVNIIKIK